MKPGTVVVAVVVAGVVAGVAAVDDGACGSWA